MSDGLIIAVCGDSGAGKSTTTGLLRDEGFAPYSLSAFLRQEAEAAIDTPTREQVQSHGKNQQERHGNHYYAEVLIAKTDLMAQRRAVIDGDVENGSLMAGQSVGMLKQEEPVAAIIEKLMAQSEDALTRRG